MSGNARQVLNMANSIVGVSILSMPFCFKETGLLLGIVLTLVTGFITKKTCMFLIRSAIMARRRSYEFLAFHVFGVSGKLFVEMCMILFLIGICISFHVVMGDLAPAIVARFMNVENSSSLRCTLLVGIGVLVILPLCLLRNLDNLASMSACSIMFYVFLVTVIFWHAFPKLWDGTWIHTAELWRPAGALQVLPILSLALACQSNVFEIYDSVPDPDVPKMRFVVNHAVNLCSALYISVGFLGYVAFVDKDFGGNIIMSLPNSELTEGIKVFFTVSLAISFPLMIFPCRTSIHSLLYRRSNPSSYDLVGNYMPESRFKAITFGILLFSLIIGILIPNIEFVLGLLGSTMGMLIALILPSLLFIKVNSKASAERLLAQGVMLVGLMLIVTGTYLNLAHIYAVQTEVRSLPTEIAKTNSDLQLPKIDDKAPESVKKGHVSSTAEDTATRKEPVAPEPPPDEKKEVVQKEIVKEEVKDPSEKSEKIKVGEKESVKHEGDDVVKPESKEKQMSEKKTNFKKTGEGAKETKDGGDTLHPDAIQKEEKVNEEEIDKDEEGKDIEKKQAEILEKMEVQHQEQQQILEEQKKILKELKDQKMKQEEDAKKSNAGGAGNAEGQQQQQSGIVANHALSQGVKSLVDPALPQGAKSILDDTPAKPQLSQDNSPPLVQAVPGPDAVDQARVGNNVPPVDSKAHGGVDGIAAAAGASKQPVLNSPQINQPPSVPVLSIGNNNLNQVPMNSGAKINPQLPMMYYNNNGQNFAANPGVQNLVHIPPSAALPEANVMGQQLPAAGVPGANAVGQQLPAAALPAASGVIQQLPAAALPAPGQQFPAASVLEQQLPAGSLMNQPGLNPIVQPQAGQAVPGANFLVQPALSSNFANQPLLPINLAAQPLAQSNLGQQPVILGNVAGQQSVPVNPVGQPVQVNVGGQPVQVNVGGQPGIAVNPGGQPVAQVNLVAQPVAPVVVAGQLPAQSNVVNQPAPGVNNADQPVVLTNNVVQPVISGNNAYDSKDNVKSKIKAPEIPLSKKQPSIKFDKDDEEEAKHKLVNSVSRNVPEKLSKLEEEAKFKTAGVSESKAPATKDVPRKQKAAKKAKEYAAEEKKERAGKLKDRKKTQHDEERRKRQADDSLIVDLPQAEIMRELKWKDFGDVAYDTRHLLWTGRSRRKKRNKGRDEDYYWDET